MKQQSLPQFASDNYAGMCPEALTAMLEANTGHHSAYGDDMWTALASDHFRKLFKTDCEVFFVFNGTAANSLALASLCRSYHSVICADFAHVETDECGAPEFFSNGSKLLTVQTVDGKITPQAILEMANKRSDLHFPKPKAVTITQASEVGTVYSPCEVRAIGDQCKELGLHLHMDGARFANAVAHLKCDPSEITWKAGVDVLCFGGTKNGMAIGEAIIFFNKELAEDFEYRCKQAGQLCSKMRFLAAPWVGLLTDDVWLKYGAHSNDCARVLSDEIAKIEGIKLMFATQANGVFVEIPEKAQEYLRAQNWMFYTFIGAGGVRLMCAWDMTLERVHQFIADLKKAMLSL